MKPSPTHSLQAFVLYLGIGKIDLATGDTVLGVLGEAIGCERGTEITQWRGWCVYLDFKETLCLNTKNVK